MAKVCNLSLLPDVSQPPNLDGWLRSAAADLKAWCGVEKEGFPPRKVPFLIEILFIKRTHEVKPEQLAVLAVVDFTKLGTLTTITLNKHCTLLAKVLSRNPGCYLKITWHLFLFQSNSVLISQVLFASISCFNKCFKYQWNLVGRTPLGVSLGSAGLILAPLLYGTAGGGSLRKDYRSIGWKMVKTSNELDSSWINILWIFKMTSSVKSGKRWPHGRLIENKAEQLGLALRDVRLLIDGSSLHGNSERPQYFTGWLAIPDATLPPKGVAYRRNTNEEDLKGVTINSFTNSGLWKLQGLALDEVPQALPEAEFSVPATKSYLVSNDSRRNLTDIQETAQWIAGKNVFSKILSATLGGLFYFSPNSQLLLYV